LLVICNSTSNTHGMNIKLEIFFVNVVSMQIISEHLTKNINIPSVRSLFKVVNEGYSEIGILY
jgi:hypothetical protein